MRLDVVLVRIGLFSNVRLARFYIKRFGVIVNGRSVFNFNYVLRLGDILSVQPEHKIFFKLKLFLKLNPSRVNLLEYTGGGAWADYSKDQLEFFNRFVCSELRNFSYYDRFLSVSSSFGSFDLDVLRKNRSVFFFSYFTRCLEVNFNSFEFLYVFPLDSFDIIKYPFKVKSLDVKRLVESAF